MEYKILADETTPLERKVQVRIDSDSVKEIWQCEVKTLAGEVKLDGFRQGKAPLNVVE